MSIPGALLAKHCCLRRGRGFTLIELLIVIAIIAVLVTMVGVVAPVIQNKINATKCQRNLKTIHQVLMGYAEQNDGWLPEFSHYWGDSLTHQFRWDGGSRPTLDVWVAMSDVALLKQLGGSAEVFFCPLYPDYGNYDDWQFDSWNHPVTSGDSYVARLGYYTTINRGSIYNSPLTDGRMPIRKVQAGTDNMPIFADLLRFGPASWDPAGWYHGTDSDNVLDRAFTGGGNTLFFGGSVVWKEWGELELQAEDKSLGCGAKSGETMFWFWLGQAMEE
ncbi:MAG: type II secretion system protein [Planctomycetes bacterium]|nr:type II secretion system protein [Planctomycetota bacterium]